MNRRTLLGAAGVCCALGVAGCLDSEAETEAEADPNGSDPSPRYGRPTYSEWPPAEGLNGGGVLFAQLRLEEYPAIQRAIAEGRLDTSHPVVGLGVDSIDRIGTAVETLSAYPFGDTLRQAVLAASTPDGQLADDLNQTLVDPASDALSPTNESAENGSTETEPVENDSIENDLTGNESAENDSIETETAVDDPEPLTAAELGIETDRVALIDDLLVFEGTFDQSAIIDQFGENFEQVDTLRGVSIYEGREELSGLAFALTGSRLLVAVAVDGRAVDGERILAHSLSGYISTVGRIVDDADGEWLFETTGPAALGVGFWETPVDNYLADTAVATDRPGVAAVFESVGSCLCAVERVDDTDRLPGFEARFSGLYPVGTPNEADLRSAFAGNVDPKSLSTDTSRAQVTATLSDQ